MTLYSLVILLFQFRTSSMSGSNCCFLTHLQVSQETGKVFWYSHLFKSFLQFVVIHRVKGFSTVSEEEEGFLKLPWFFRVTNLISGSSASLKPSLYIWKFSVHTLLKPSLWDFEYNLASLWNEHNCTTVWTLFALPFFGIGTKMDLF